MILECERRHAAEWVVLLDGARVPLTIEGAGGGGPSSPPPMSKEEKLSYAKQAEATDMYMQLARKQQATADALEPYLYKQLGLEKVSTRGEREELVDKYTAQLAKTSQFLSGPDERAARWYGTYGGNLDGYDAQGRRINPQYTNISKELERAKAMAPTYAIREIAPTPEELQRREILDLSNKRTLAGLKGELPVDPAVENDLKRGRAQLDEVLARRGIRPGSGDVYNRAVSEFDRGADALRYEVRTGAMTTADAMATNRNNELMRKQAQYIGGSRQYQGEGANMIGQGASLYGANADRLTRNRYTDYGLMAQESAARGAGTGSIIAGGTSAAMAIGMGALAI